MIETTYKGRTIRYHEHMNYWQDVSEEDPVGCRDSLENVKAAIDKALKKPFERFSVWGRDNAAKGFRKGTATSARDGRLRVSYPGESSKQAYGDIYKDCPEATAAAVEMGELDAQIVALQMQRRELLRSLPKWTEEEILQLEENSK